MLLKLNIRNVFIQVCNMQYYLIKLVVLIYQLILEKAFLNANYLWNEMFFLSADSWRYRKTDELIHDNVNVSL